MHRLRIIVQIFAMKCLFLSALAALALVACSETPKEAPMRQPAPDAEAPAPRAPHPPVNQPHQIRGATATDSGVSFTMDGREVAFASLESRTSMLGLGADHLTVRLSEYSSQRTVLIGFRNVINADYTGNYSVMGSARSSEPQAVVNVLNCGQGGAKHVTMKKGTVRIKSVDPATGAVSLDFDGTCYSLSDNNESTPIMLKGSFDLVMPTVQDKR